VRSTTGEWGFGSANERFWFWYLAIRKVVDVLVASEVHHNHVADELALLSLQAVMIDSRRDVQTTHEGVGGNRRKVVINIT